MCAWLMNKKYLLDSARMSFLVIIGRCGLQKYLVQALLNYSVSDEEESDVIEGEC